jgi:hypothetical protein
MTTQRLSSCYLTSSPLGATVHIEVSVQGIGVNVKHEMPAEDIPEFVFGLARNYRDSAGEPLLVWGRPVIGIHPAAAKLREIAEVSPMHIAVALRDLADNL